MHLNFSPVVLHEGWEAEWTALFAELDDALPAAVKEQLAAEVIMLTHNEGLHEVNLAWHPKAEAVLWRPDIQERKRVGGRRGEPALPDGVEGALARRGSRRCSRSGCRIAGCGTPSRGLLAWRRPT